MVGCSWSEFFVSGVIMADLNLLPSRFYWIYITCYWFIFHSVMIFPIVCTAYKHNLTALIGLLNFLQLFLFCNFGQKWLKWFVAPAADCLHIHEEPDMLNVHVVRLSTLCWKVLSSFPHLIELKMVSIISTITLLLLLYCFANHTQQPQNPHLFISPGWIHK